MFFENKQTCFLIGSGNLAVYCAKHLLKNDFFITGAVSFDDSFDDFLKINAIPVYEFAELEKILKANTVHYLLSIVNPFIIDKKILSLPTVAAINYHDSLLPRYAGAYSTAWAILNNEIEHGITWHHMSEKFDCGDIIAESAISIAEDETTASLNVKCFEAAKIEFNRILVYLANQKIPSIKQDITTRNENFFHRKPPNLGYLNFKKSIHNIDRLCRALDFGSYDNAFGHALITIDDSDYVVKSWEIKKTETNNLPASIHSISSHLEIQALDGIFSLKIAVASNGEELSGNQIAKKHNLKAMSTLPLMDEIETTKNRHALAKLFNEINNTENTSILQTIRLESLFINQSCNYSPLLA